MAAGKKVLEDVHESPFGQRIDKVYNDLAAKKSNLSSPFHRAHDAQNNSINNSLNPTTNLEEGCTEQNENVIKHENPFTPQQVEGELLTFIRVSFNKAVR